MNYPEELRERYNEVMYDERDIIEKFLKDQYDLRYGHQRDTWHFEPAIEMMAYQGSTVTLTDIELNKDTFVNFIVDTHLKKGVILECFDFAYGELSKVIEALPNAEELNEKNAEADLLSLASNGTINIDNNPYTFTDAMGNKYDVLSVSKDEEEVGKILYEVHETLADGRDGGFGLWPDVDADVVVGLRNHINIEVLHRYNEYNKLVKFLSEQPNLCFEPANLGDVEFTIHGTDVKVDVLSASLDSNGKLQLCVDDDNKEAIYLEEKDIRPEYLVDLVSYIEDHCYCDIIDTSNGHNPELVKKINAAWKSPEYHYRFAFIVYSIAQRDYSECEEKFCCDMGNFLSAIIDDCNADVIHNVLENICDDIDLQTILLFIRY